MRNSIAFIALLAAPQLAAAQQPDIVDACAKALELQIGQEFAVENVQSFPKLEPPRVRFDAYGEGGDPLSGSLAARIAEMTGEAVPEPTVRKIASARCEFENPTPPFGLSAFSCSGNRCEEIAFDDGSRLEELQVLLGREGF